MMHLIKLRPSPLPLSSLIRVSAGYTALPAIHWATFIGIKLCLLVYSSATLIRIVYTEAEAKRTKNYRTRTSLA